VDGLRDPTAGPQRRPVRPTTTAGAHLDRADGAQTATALFFSGNALIQYNTALRDQVTVRHLDMVDAARGTRTG
jgi:hypothetical protein